MSYPIVGTARDCMYHIICMHEQVWSGRQEYGSLVYAGTHGTAKHGMHQSAPRSTACSGCMLLQLAAMLA
jgi:hypothetical protein